MEILIIALFALFGIAAAQDYTKREVQDWVSILAWLVSALLFDKFFIFVFVGAWALAELCNHFKMPLFGWGDVLWLPVFGGAIALETNWWMAVLAIMGAMLCAQLYLGYQTKILKLTKKKIRGSAFVFVMFLMLLMVYGFKTMGLL